MKISLLSKGSGRFSGVLGGLLGALLLVGCSTVYDEMNVVEKNLEEGRLVPSRAVETGDFLNHYRHPLREPRNGLLGVHIETASKYVLTQGGKTLMQIGLSSRQSDMRPVQLHLLMYVSDPLNKETQKKFFAVIPAVKEHKRASALVSSLTVDWSTAPPAGRRGDAALLDQKSSANLEEFLRRFVVHPFDRQNHHVVLIVGEYAWLSARQKQDILDMASIFRVKSVTLSVLSVGNKPDVAFLNRLSDKGRGTFNIVTSEFSGESWLEEDLRHRSAGVLSDIKVTARFKNNVTINTIRSPKDIDHSDNALQIDIPSLKRGEQRVLLAELTIPKMKVDRSVEITDVEVSYLDEEHERYHRVYRTHRIDYTDDQNIVSQHKNIGIRRSLLILKTQDTLRDVESAIRDRRNYHAIAMLTRQSRELSSIGSTLKDEEILRDARILDKYAERLYDFDDEAFKTIKRWKDLYWDQGRFTDTYQ